MKTLCRHDRYGAFDMYGNETLDVCAECDREQQWADEDREAELIDYSGIRDDADDWY